MLNQVELLKKLIQATDPDKIIGVVLDSGARKYFNNGERFNYQKHIDEDIGCMVIKDIDTDENEYNVYIPIKYIESFLVSNNEPVEVFNTRYIGM